MTEGFTFRDMHEEEGDTDIEGHVLSRRADEVHELSEAGA
jgi:hypothetical protein